MLDGEQLLAALDRAAQVGDFPILDHGYMFPADTCLSLFIGPERWLLLIEVLVFHNHLSGHAAIRTQRYAYGSGRQGPLDPDLTLTGDAASEPVFDPLDGQKLASSPSRIRVRDSVFPVPLDRGVYQAESIVLADPDAVFGYEYLRWLAPRARPLFFSGPGDIGELLPPCTRPSVSLHEWRHPDILAGERPSDSDTFKECAEVITSGGSKPFAGTRAPNTHWSNWPMAGQL